MLYNINWTLYHVHYTLYIIHITMYTLQCTLYSVHFTMYTIHYTLYTLQCTLYNVHYTLYTIYTVYETGWTFAIHCSRGLKCWYLIKIRCSGIVYLLPEVAIPYNPRPGLLRIAVLELIYRLPYKGNTLTHLSIWSH